MEHDKFKENLSAYMDGELKGGELAALEAHLASCPECARELAGLKKVSAIFKKHAPEAVPHPLKEAVFSGLEKPAAPAWLKPAVVFATAAAALLVVFALPKFTGDRPVFSPNLFQNSFYDESASSSQGFGSRAAPDMSSLESAAPAAGDGSSAQAAGENEAMAPAPALKLEAAAERKDAGPRYAAPAFSKAGAFGQAKMARSAAGSVRGAMPAKQEEPGGVFASLSGAGAAVSGAAASFAGDSAEAANRPAAPPPARAKAKAALPGWVSQRIKRLRAAQRGNPPYEIWKYSYKGQAVYFLPAQCCDQYSELYDEAGRPLCAPDGGFAGSGDGRCPGFHDEAKDGELVWKDSRK